MTSKYNPHVQTPPPDPHELLEIGIELTSKSMDIYDMGNGEEAYVPALQKLVFIKIERQHFSEQSEEHNNIAYIKEVLRHKGYGAAWNIQSIWLAENTSNDII